MKNKKDRNGKKSGKKSLIPSFLSKLYQILENSEYHHIINWSENGKAFVVINLSLFIEQVLPYNFKHNNFASFVRQLNMYDFHKTRNINNENHFSHKLFSRGQKNLLKSIKRKINRKDSMDEEFSEIDHSPQTREKKKIESVYSDVINKLEDFSKRQLELEIKIDKFGKKNEKLAEENSEISEEVSEKKKYTKNLEVLNYLIYELILKNPSAAKNFVLSNFTNSDDNLMDFGKDNTEYLNINSSNNLSLINKLQSEEISTVSLLSSSIKDTNKKVELVDNLLQNLDIDIIKLLIEKTLQKNHIPKENIKLIIPKKCSSIKENKISTHEDEINTGSPSINIDNRITINTLFQLLQESNERETRVSSPTSLLSTSEFQISNNSLKISNRKRLEDECGNGILNLNQKEKDTIFDEITGLTPCLISSPTMSPKKISIDGGSNYYNNGFSKKSCFSLYSAMCNNQS